MSTRGGTTPSKRRTCCAIAAKTHNSAVSKGLPLDPVISRCYTPPILFEGHLTVRRLLTLLALTAVSLAFAVYGSERTVRAETPEFKDVVNVSNTAGNSKDPSIAVSGSTVHVVWGDNIPGNDEIFYARSVDRGETFSTPMNLSNNTFFSVSPSVVAQGDTVYVVWMQGTPDFYQVSYVKSTDNGQTFTSEANLSGEADDLNTWPPMLAADGAAVYVGWVYCCQTNNRQDVFVISSTDSGGSFSSPANISSDDDNSELLEGAASGDNVYLAWQNNILGVRETRFSRSTDNGSSFSEQSSLGNSSASSVAAVNDTVYVALVDNSSGNNEVLLRKSSDAGVTFGSSSNLSASAGSSIDPTVSASGINVSVVWREDGDIKFIHSDDDGVSFGTSVVLGTGQEPSIDTSDSRVYAVWRDSSNDIFFRRWAPPLMIHSVEFTQAIQVWQTVDVLKADLEGDGSPPVPIVAGKPAVMRIYASEVDTQTDVTFAVTFDGGATIEESVTLGTECTADDRRVQPPSKPQCKSVNIYFTPPSGSFTVELTATTDTDTEEHVFNLTSIDTMPLTVVGVPVCLPSCSSLVDLAPFLPIVRKLYPVAEVNLVYKAGTSINPPAIPPVGSAGILVTAQYVQMMRLSTGSVFNDELWYGVIKPSHSPEGGGWAFPGTRASAGVGHPVSPGVIKWTEGAFLLAHEMAHNLGRGHAPCGDPSGVDDNWPHDTNPEARLKEVGFDVAAGEIVQPLSEPVDLMSYCQPVWVTTYTYNALIADFAEASATEFAADAILQVPGRFWHISGIIEDASATLFSVFEVETTGSIEPGVGSHRIEVFDGGGTLLFTRFFDPAIAESRDLVAPPFFSELVPVDGAASSILIFDDGENQVATLDLTGTAPVVDIVFPNGGEQLDGIQDLSWTVSDPDSTEHSYRVQYSTDNGVTWSEISGDISDTSLDVDFDQMPGAITSRIRVLASDGVNTGIGMSQAFSVPLKAPEAAIASPEDGSIFRLRQLVWLQGVVLDLEDGFLDAAIEWVSDVDGALGSGSDLPLTTLSEGTHVITLFAEDNDGNPVSDSITIEVVDEPLTEVEPPLVPGVTVWGLVALAVLLLAGAGYLRLKPPGVAV